MQCIIQIVNILLLLIFSFDKSKITSTIKIFQEFIKRLGLDNHILYNKKIIFKGNYMTVQNIA